MKFLINVLCFLFIPFVLAASDINSKQESFEHAIKEIVQAYTTKNDTLINKYIDTESGIYFIVKVSNERYWLHRNRACMTQECINKYSLPNPYAQILVEQKLDTTFNIKYKQIEASDANCHTISVDEKNLHLLTNTIRKFKQKRDIHISNNELQKIWRTESNSKRIQVSKIGSVFGDGKFVFYLNYLNKNWYLSIIDFNN